MGLKGFIGKADQRTVEEVRLAENTKVRFQVAGEEIQTGSSQLRTIKDPF